MQTKKVLFLDYQSDQTGRKPPYAYDHVLDYTLSNGYFTILYVSWIDTLDGKLPDCISLNRIHKIEIPESAIKIVRIF